MDRQGRTRVTVLVKMPNTAQPGYKMFLAEVCSQFYNENFSALKQFPIAGFSIITLFWISFMLKKIILTDPKILLITINFDLGGSRRQTGAGQ
jgi:hypothetical protein